MKLKLTLVTLLFLLFGVTSFAQTLQCISCEASGATTLFTLPSGGTSYYTSVFGVSTPTTSSQSATAAVNAVITKISIRSNQVLTGVGVGFTDVTTGVSTGCNFESTQSGGTTSTAQDMLECDIVPGYFGAGALNMAISSGDTLELTITSNQGHTYTDLELDWTFTIHE